MKKIFNYLVVLIIPFMFINNAHASTTFKTCTVNEPSYFRSTPGGSIMTDVDKQNVLVRSPMRLEVIEETSGYKKVRGNYYSNNYVGWIADKYLTDFKTYTTDDNYGNTLRNAGFPENYILPLQKLHAIHPSWNFKVSKYGNGLSFNDVINGEYSPVSKNLINSPYTTLRSTDGEAYNNGTYKQFEPGWYAASRQTLEFYIDPRNWLTENTVFMFEQLSYDSDSHTEAAVNKVVSGTYLSGLTSALVKAGKKYNVSPIALAVRAIQEQGSNGSGITAKMTSNGKTYYNYFNINATGSTTSAIYNNALNTAIKNNWTTPEASINGGASVISNNYIALGQDTNYYQKFNTINGKSLYWNQYMTNVRVLPSESYNSYLTYQKSNKLDSGITFKVPVYNNMPDSTTLNISGNGDNTLKSLTVSNCSFTFYSSVVNYTCNVPSNTTNVTVSATKASSYSSVTGTGSYKLDQNSKTVSVVVTAANGNQKIYNVTINKSNNVTNNTTSSNTNSNSNVVQTKVTIPSSIISALGLSNRNNNVYGFNVGYTRNSLLQAIKAKFSGASVTIKNKYNQNQSNGAMASGDKITITSGSQTITYTAVINGDPSGDGVIDIADLAMIKAKMLGKVSFNTVDFDAADVNNDDKVDIADLAMVKAHMLGKIKITK